MPYEAQLHLARLAEINKKRELDLKFQAKEREIGLALRVQQEMKLTTWLKTATRPPLLWLPRTHNEETKLLLEQRLKDVTAWKVTAISPELYSQSVTGGTRADEINTGLSGNCLCIQRSSVFSAGLFEGENNNNTVLTRHVKKHCP